MAGEAVKGKSFFGYVVQFPRKKWQCGVAPTRDVTRLPGYNDIILRTTKVPTLSLFYHSSLILILSHTLSLSLSQHLITVLIMSAMCAPIPSKSSFGVEHVDFIFQYARSSLNLLSGKCSLPLSGYWSDCAIYRTPRFHIGCF